MMPNRTSPSSSFSDNDSDTCKTVSKNRNYNRELENIVTDGHTRVKRVDIIADWLSNIFNAPASRAFYCSIAYSLSITQIAELVDVSFRAGRNPERLFGYLAKKELDTAANQAYESTL